MGEGMTPNHRPVFPAELSGEGELLVRIQGGDERAFDELYRRYRSRLTRFLFSLMHRPQLVEEVLDDTMIAVWEKPTSFRGASKLSTWIFAIAYRKAMKALRRLDEPVELDEPDNRASEETPSDERAWYRQRERLLCDVMQGLSADHRAVLDMTYFHEMTYREISEIMGCPVDTVKTRMFHARRNLRRLMAGDSADWI